MTLGDGPGNVKKKKFSLNRKISSAQSIKIVNVVKKKFGIFQEYQVSQDSINLVNKVNFLKKLVNKFNFQSLKKNAMETT